MGGEPTKAVQINSHTKSRIAAVHEKAPKSPMFPGKQSTTSNNEQKGCRVSDHKRQGEFSFKFAISLQFPAVSHKISLFQVVWSFALVPLADTQPAEKIFAKLGTSLPTDSDVSHKSPCELLPLYRRAVSSKRTIHLVSQTRTSECDTCRQETQGSPQCTRTKDDEGGDGECQSSCSPGNVNLSLSRERREVI